MNVWVQVVLAVITAASSVPLGLFTVRRQAKKITAETELTEASAADTLAGVAVKLVEPLTKRLADAEAQATALSAALQAAQAEIQDLRSTVERLTKELEAKSGENPRASQKRSR